MSKNPSIVRHAWIASSLLFAVGCSDDGPVDQGEIGEDSGPNGADGGADGGGSGEDTTPPVCMTHAQGGAAAPQSGLDKVTWARGLPQTAYASVVASTVDGSYAAVMGGPMSELLGKSLPAPGNPLVVRGGVAKLDAGGQTSWVVSLGRSEASSQAYGAQVSVRARAAGGVFVLLGVNGSLQVGTQPALTLDDTKSQVVLAAIDAAGSVLWSKQVATGMGEEVRGWQLEVDPQGNPLLLLWGTKVQIGAVSYDCGLVFGKFDGNGSPQQARCVSSTPMSVYEGAMSVDAQGNVAITGFPFGMDPNFGKGPFAVDAGAGGGFVVKFNPAGELQWQTAFLRAYPDMLGFDSDGALLLTGNMPQKNSMNGLIELGKKHYLPCDDGYQTHLTRLDGDGTPLWSRSYGDVTLDVVALHPAAHTVFFQGQHATMGPLAEGLPVASSELIFGVADAKTDGSIRWVQSGLFLTSVVAEHGSDGWLGVASVSVATSLAGVSLENGPALVKLAP
ncbi:MAG: hypothetical protein QM778_11655 [Myxococcales bacterium]